MHMCFVLVCVCTSMLFLYMTIFSSLVDIIFNTGHMMDTSNALQQYLYIGMTFIYSKCY